MDTLKLDVPLAIIIIIYFFLIRLFTWNARTMQVKKYVHVI